jgi:hypothetical protein
MVRGFASKHASIARLCRKSRAIGYLRTKPCENSALFKLLQVTIMQQRSYYVKRRGSQRNAPPLAAGGFLGYCIGYRRIISQVPLEEEGHAAHV